MIAARLDTDLFDKYTVYERQNSVCDREEISMRQNTMRRFDGALPEASFAIVQEMAEKLGMSIRSFVSMAVMKHAVDLKREMDDICCQRTIVLSKKDAEKFTALIENADEVFGNKTAEYLALAKNVDTKVD